MYSYRFFSLKAASASKSWNPDPLLAKSFLHSKALITVLLHLTLEQDAPERVTFLSIWTSPPDLRGKTGEITAATIR